MYPLYIFLFILSVGLSVYLIVSRNKKSHGSVFFKKAPALWGASLVRSGRVSARSGMLFSFSCDQKEEHSSKSIRKGERFVEKRDYGVFSLTICFEKKEGIYVYEITHTHIVPQIVKCTLKERSELSVFKNGYLARTLKGERVGFLLVGAKSAEIKGNSLYFSVGERAYIIASKDAVPRVKSIKRFLSAEKNPFNVYTPELKLNGFFNEWLWDIIAKEEEKSFDKALVFCAVRLLYRADSCVEFLKTAFFEAGENSQKRWVVLLLLCEYSKRSGKNIFDSAVGKFTLKNFVNSFIKEKKWEEKALFLCALSEYSAWVESPRDKLDLLSFIEVKRENDGVSREDILGMREKFIFLPFIRENSLAKELFESDGSDYSEILSKYNTLNGAPTPDFLTASFFYLGVVKGIFGAEKEREGYRFKPRFPKGWKSAVIKCSSDGRIIETELVSGDKNSVVVDGVEYSGEIVRNLPKERGKCVVYFKE